MPNIIKEKDNNMNDPISSGMASIMVVTNVLNSVVKECVYIFMCEFA